MNTLREYALEAWAQEQERRKNAERKKRKRKAKKIEEDIDDLLPRDAEGLQLERDVDDPVYAAVVVVTDIDGKLLRFTYDDNDELSLIGECLACHKITLSEPILSAANLGEMIERFAPAVSHDCTVKE